MDVKEMISLMFIDFNLPKYHTIKECELEIQGGLLEQKMGKELSDEELPI